MGTFVEIFTQTDANGRPIEGGPLNRRLVTKPKGEIFHIAGRPVKLPPGSTVIELDGELEQKVKDIERKHGFDPKEVPERTRPVNRKAFERGYPTYGLESEVDEFLLNYEKQHSSAKTLSAQEQARRHAARLLFVIEVPHHTKNSRTIAWMLPGYRLQTVNPEVVSQPIPRYLNKNADGRFTGRTATASLLFVSWIFETAHAVAIKERRKDLADALQQNLECLQETGRLNVLPQQNIQTALQVAFGEQPPKTLQTLMHSLGVEA